MSMIGNTVEPDYSKEIERILRKFNLGCSFKFALHGPAVTRYVFSPDPETKVSSIIRNADKIASEIAVDGVRILDSIPELASIYVEIPNKYRETIRIEDVLPSLNKGEFRLPVVLGRTVEGDDFVFDFADAPHVLIAGRPESGKTMVLHSIIRSLTIGMRPEDVQLIFAQVDGKWNSSLYDSCDDYLQKPIHKTVEDVFSMLDSVVLEIERRMCLFSEANVIHLDEYNAKEGRNLPYLVIVIEGMAEVIMQDKRRFEMLIRRITSVARFCGVHIVLTTNIISADIITPTIKTNIPTTIALAVSNKIQSRIAIDHVGAEVLLGEGDMLYYRYDMHQPIRIQGVLCGSDEDDC